MVRFFGAWLAISFTMGAAVHAATTPCADLWFARNATTVAAGQCPETPLSITVFDGAECVGGATEFDSEVEAWLASIVAREVEFSCNVDELAEELSMDNIAIRKQLVLQPIRRQRELRCIMNAPTSLWSGPDIDVAEQIGWLDKDDRVVIVHDIEGGVAFASQVRRGGRTTDLIGWFGRTHCRT